MKILLIDDKKSSVESVVSSLEEIYGEENVTTLYNKKPKINEILGLLNNSFDVVFVDYEFSKDKSVITGADLGLQIRMKYPLLAIILMTAYGEENIRNFIYVGFDDYYEKSRAGLADEKELLKNCIDNATSNKEKRIKTKFSSDELQTCKVILDSAEEASQNLIGKVNICLKGAEIYAIKQGKEKPISRVQFQSYFNLKKNGAWYNINPDALKTLQLLKENPNEWPKARQRFDYIKELLNNFGLEQPIKQEY